MNPPPAIGRYEVRRELGRGMMGVVYEAHDPALGRAIALKVIQIALGAADGEQQAYEERFFSEARTAARLSHPGIVVVHDVGRDAGTGALYMALELLRGETLDAMLKRRGPLPWRDALRIAQRVAEALDHAHAHGVVHRDIKPANIMLLASGEPKIMDFGIAKLEASQLTAAGQFLGTPLYMSPEQALAHPVDGRSDLFSLGSVLYEMVTGRQAFAGENVTKIVFQIVSREPAAPSVVVPTLSAEIDAIITRCLSKDLERRYPNGRSLAEDIEDVLAGRPPRGLAAWSTAKAGSGTIVAPPAAAAPQTVAPPPTVVAPRVAKAAAAPPRGPAPTAAAAPPKPAPKRWAQELLGLALLAATAAAIGGVLLYRTVGTEPVARRLTQPSPAPSPEDDNADSSAPSDEAKPADASAPAPSKVPANASRLTIDFEHSLKAGVLKVWVDDQPVIEQNFAGRVTKKLGGLELRKGRVAETLEIKPGRRAVKVQVAWEDTVKTDGVTANFKPGASLRLKARLGGLGGLKKDLSLEFY